MKSEIYYLKLKVISPVHIGCDEVYEPTGFALDEQKKELIAFEPASFLGMLEQQDLDQYSAICRKGTVSSLLEIYKFIRLHKEFAQGRRVAVSDAFVDHYNKTLKLSPNVVQQQLNKFQVGRTAFQRVDAVPYIPGSAIKGALRTAVLNLRNAGKTHPKYRNGKQLNEELSGGTFATDPFRLIKVGDFRPVKEVKQKIVYGVNRKKRLSEKEARGPYQILEVIEPGAEFVGTITVQQAHSMAGIRKPVQFDEIEKALSGFYPRELRKETMSLKTIGCDVPILEELPPEMMLIRIGRHSGAECVTVEGHRNIKIMQGPGVKYKDHATTLWLAAGSDNPSGNKSLQPFGWAGFTRLSIEEVRQFEKERADMFHAWESGQQEAITVFREKANLLIRQREAEKLEQKRLANEQRKKEEELQKYPWRCTVLPKLELISDWGALRTQALEQEDFKQYQAEGEVGQAVAEVAVRVAKAIGKKWDGKRDDIVAEWLQPSSVKWERQSPVETPTPNNPLLEKIRSFKTPADYDRSLEIANLDIECCRALQPLFKSWKWNRQRAKAHNHQLWKALQERISRLK